MGLQNILEGVIGSLIATAISGGAVYLFSTIFDKNKVLSGTHNQKFHISKMNPFGIALFITSFFTILSVFPRITIIRRERVS